MKILILLKSSSEQQKTKNSDSNHKQLKTCFGRMKKVFEEELIGLKDHNVGRCDA